MLSKRVLFSLASIKTKLRSVAKSGLIMPEPLANPVIAISLEPLLIKAVSNLGFVSVVRIDLAAFLQLLFFNCLDAFKNAFTYSFVFKGSPITPVEKGKTDS